MSDGRDNRSPGVYVRPEGDRGDVADERCDDVAAIAAALRVALSRGRSLDDALREVEADRIAEETFLSRPRAGRATTVSR